MPDSRIAGSPIPKAPVPRPPKAPTAKGVSGSVGGPSMGRSQGVGKAPSLRGVTGSTGRPGPFQGMVKQVTGLQGLPKPQAESGVMREAKALSSLKGLERPKPQGGGGLLATITNFPARVEQQGYKNIASITGVPQINKIGNLAAEAVNIPTQVLPSAYYAGKALGAAKAGKPQELHELAKQFAKESSVAHLVKGDFKGAAEAAGHHPLNTALEVGGVATAADRALGAVGRLSGVEAAKLTDTGATTASRNPRGYAPEVMPPAREGGATVAQRPYHKGLVRPMLEKKVSAQPVPTGKVRPTLRQSFDRLEGEHLFATRATRDSIVQHRNQTVKGVKQQGAIVPHGQWLADPSAINPETKVPFAHEHLQEMIDHLSKAPPGEFAHEAKIREANVAHLKALQGKNLTPGYDAALKVAQDKRNLEPELVKHRVYTPETIRSAKLIPAFQFHFRGENPFVETTVKPGESPFRLGGPEGRVIPVDEVAKALEAKGVHEKQLSFVSTRPFENGNAAFRSGRQPGGAKVAKGHLSGHALMRGQFDPTYDAAIRQHLTDAGIINKARGDLRFSREYVHTRAQVAKLLEARAERLPPEHQAALHDYIQNELRSGGGLHFEQKGGKSGWQRALEANEHLKSLYPESQLEPIRVAHPYATAEYRKGLGEHLDLGATADKLDPSNFGPEHDFWKTRAPDESAAQHDVTAGPVGLTHQEIRDRVRAYESDLGQAHLARMPSSFWRKTNVAFSVRHIPGVAQEVGGRMLMNNVGLLSGLRGTRALSEIKHYAEGHPDPFVKLAGQRLESVTGGSVARQALEQVRHVPRNQLAATKFAKAAEWWDKGVARPITGAPLRAVRGAVRAFNGTTNAILHFERNTIEHPPQVAGAGKHFNEEFQRLHGQRLKVIGAFSDVEKAFLRGRLDPKAIDHFSGVSREYWGNWTRSSPEFKKYQAVSPFLQWYLNSLRFVYHTMPAHHPMKSGLIAAIEGATREQRLAEGQEYKGGLPLGSHLNSTDMEASQQGSIPNFLGNPKTERMGQEYYTPQGAVSAGPLETALGALLPYASGIYLTSKGVNPLTNRPLEETVEGKKQRITDANQLGLLGALSVAESFVPPLRYEQSLQKKPPGYVFRPFRTEKTRTEVPEKKAKESKLGGSLGKSSLGGKLGGSLK